MKRKLLCALCASLCTFFMFAQIASLENQATGGVFKNEIDTAFRVGPGFGKYKQQFLYAGWANPYDTTVSAMESSASDGIKAGYYRPGKMPMSFYGRFSGRKMTNGNWKNGSESTWNDVQHSQLLTTTKTSFTRILFLRRYDFSVNYLVGIGKGKNLVSGLNFSFRGDNTDFDQADVEKRFKKIKHTNELNSSADYTLTCVNVDEDHAPDFAGALAAVLGGAAVPTTLLPAGFHEKESIHEFRLGVPVGFKTGDLHHTAYVELKSDLTNFNSRYERKDSTGTTKYSRVWYKSLTDIGVQYNLRLGVKESEEDMWRLGGRMALAFGNDQGSWKYEGANGESAKYSVVKAPGIGFSLDLDASRSFTFPSPKKTITLKAVPVLGCALYTGMAEHFRLADMAHNETVKAEAKVGANTYSYVSTDKTGCWENHTSFQASAELPIGLKIMPEGWKIGFLLGARPAVSAKVETDWDRSGYHRKKKTTEVTFNGASTETSDDSYPSLTADNSGTPTYTWNWSEKHSFGFTVPFEGGAHMDLMLTGNDLMAIKSFKVQVFIPLGVPKARAAKSVKKDAKGDKN